MRMMESAAILLVLHTLHRIHSFPAPFVNPKIVNLNEFIKHYEPAYYSVEETIEQHVRHRRQANNLRSTSPLKITISTQHRVFKLLLTPDNSLFADDVIFEKENGQPVDFDPGKAYVGTLEDDDEAKVRGIITKDGLFDGTVTTRLEEYYIEPVSRYSENSSPTYHSIVYKMSDVTQPKTSFCASHVLHEKEKSRTEDDGVWPEFDSLRKRRDLRTPYSSEEIARLKYRPLKTVSLEEQKHPSSKIVQVYSNGLYYDLETLSEPDNSTDSKADLIPTRLPNGSIIIKKDRIKPSNVLYGTLQDHPKHYMLVPDPLKVKVDHKKTTCMLYLQADHLFFKKYNTEETCIEVMTRHVQRVNTIYKNTDFNQDGKPDNISFMIKRIKVHSMPDQSYRFPGNYGVEKFLEIFSEEDYDAFCLAYMFTYRDFEMGTLGLAWTGDLKNAGGVCEKNGHYRGSLKSLNTGIVTVLNYGKHVPSAVSHVTLAHEIGHNFGSPHDPDSCTPGGDDGNYIMFARATSGDKKNNNRFSPCSLTSINPVLNYKARSGRGCFTEPQTSICGNGVVEPGEQCDCGWEEDCKDSCCYPQRRYPPLDEPPCHLTPNSTCSPSEGPCCTNICNIKVDTLCRPDNGCRDASFCDGHSPLCPPSRNKPNKTVCNKEFVCFMGECTGSICLAYGLESCQCVPSPNDYPTKACELCCKMPGENQPCLSSFLWNTAPYDVPNTHAKPGTPCNNYNGYCDVHQNCREVDPAGPISTIKRLLLSDESLRSFKDWALSHWYFSIMFLICFIILLVLCAKFFGKKPKTKSISPLQRSPQGNAKFSSGGGVVPQGPVTVHPIVVRPKLPLNKKVRENGPTNRVKNSIQDKIQRVRKLRSPTKAKERLEKNKMKNLPPVENILEASKEDTLAKVTNWLMTSQQTQTSPDLLRKSQSSPAIASSASPAKNNARKTSQREKKSDQNKSNKGPVRLQVLYKPPFKFFLRFRKSKPQIISQVVKDKRPEVVRQRSALLIEAADQTRPNTEEIKRKGCKRKRIDSKPLLLVENLEDKASRRHYRRSVSVPNPDPAEPVYVNTQAPLTAEAAFCVVEPFYANIAKNANVTQQLGVVNMQSSYESKRCASFNLRHPIDTRTFTKKHLKRSSSQTSDNNVTVTNKRHSLQVPSGSNV